MSERLAGILVSSFTRILIPGIKVTIPLTLLSFVFGCIIALFLALVQIANVKGLKQFARFYIWVFRGTPLIVQLFIIFFGLPSVGIILDAFPSAVIAFALNLGAYNTGRTRRPDRSRLHDWTELPSDYDPDCNATGIPHCFSTTVQFPDRTDQGHFPGIQHHSCGTVHHCPADCSKNL